VSIAKHCASIYLITGGDMYLSETRHSDIDIAIPGQMLREEMFD